MTRTILAFVLAVAVPPIIGVVEGIGYWGVVTSSANIHTGSDEAFNMIPLFLIAPIQLAAVFSTLAPICGVPLYLVFQSRKISSFRVYLLTGIGIALLIVLLELQLGIISLLGSPHTALDAQSVITAVGTIISGPAATAVFWLVRRPDKANLAKDANLTL